MLSNDRVSIFQKYPSDVPSISPSLSVAPSSSPSESQKPSSSPSEQPSSTSSESSAPSSILSVTDYYDLFVKHMVTMYREVLKNIAYSVKMGMQLSHAGSKSLRYYYDGRNKVRFPDENYAR